IILKDVEVKSSAIERELTTPTGAAIVKALAKGYGALPAMIIEETGYGVGSADFKDAPNLLRLFIGKGTGGAKDSQVVVIETNIDDLSPQIAGFVMERLFEAGALDVWFTPVQMKKSRPGLLLSVLANKDKKSAVEEVIFTESTSIGVRSYSVDRTVLERREIALETRFGKVSVKVSTLGGRVVNTQPEFEELKAIALKFSLPLKSVRDEVVALLTEQGVKAGEEI
ncbi:MAG: LarC family nickel insertion protein, partial [Proteobacteria bacterium]|nr:LarC family nickel insertion protein [Pseudomonadota bacterium]